MAFLSGQVAEEEEEEKRRRKKTKERPPPVTMMNVWGMEVRIVIFGFYISPPHYLGGDDIRFGIRQMFFSFFCALQVFM